MSKRRMFSQTIVESDVFLDMPLTTQSLYFHLGMNADDDGFVNPRRIVRMVGANDDDLKLLIAKRYLLAFESGVVVVKHWKVNNFIRNDRYVTTTYQHEIKELTSNEYGAYTEISRITTNNGELTGVVDESDTNGIPSDIPTVNLVKVRLGKVKTAVSERTPVDKSKTQTTGLNANGKSFIEINALYEDLEKQQLVNNRYKAWYCKTFFKLGRERVMILASQAKADTNDDKRKLFSHLLKQESKVKA